jgi:hypothetical protein
MKTNTHFKVSPNYEGIPFQRYLSPRVLAICAVVVAIFIAAYAYSSSNKLSNVKELSLFEESESNITLEGPITYQQLVNTSREFAKRVKGKTIDKFSIGFATQNNRIEAIAKKNTALQKEIEEHANAVHPMIHARVKAFIDEMLEFKKEHGSEVEKRVYQDINFQSFVDRLIKKRPNVFMYPCDSYVLRNLQSDSGVPEGKKQTHSTFDDIGTENEEKPLILQDYQSYFEMGISALLSLVVPTHFINDGNRHNGGEIGTNYEPKGIYVGMVGPRFERPERMEWLHMIVSKDQNTLENGYGAKADEQNFKTQELRLWAKLYQSKIEGDLYAFPSYDEAAQDQSGRFKKVTVSNGYGKGEEVFLDTFVYQERLKLIVEPFLLNANRMAEEQKMKGYLHIVGLGLGVWQINDCQKQLMVDVYAELLKKLALPSITDIDFSWFDSVKKCGEVEDLQLFTTESHSIKIHFSKRNPAAKLTGDDEGKLLIAQYAWDSNAYPGNEYWLGMKSASGDPAAACCSTIGELQNPEINLSISGEKTKVLG